MNTTEPWWVRRKTDGGGRLAGRPPPVSARKQQLRVAARDREVIDPHGLVHRRAAADVGPDHELSKGQTRSRARPEHHVVPVDRGHAIEPVLNDSVRDAYAVHDAVHLQVDLDVV